MDSELWDVSPGTSDSESPAASSSSATSQGGHGEGDKSHLLKKTEEEVEGLLAILRDVGTEIDDELVREIDYMMARIEAARDAAISNKARGSMVWQYLIMPAASGFGRALFHTATAFFGSFLTAMFIFGGWRPWRPFAKLK